MSKPVRMVNTIPYVKPKKEIVLPEDEDEVQCKICSKGFLNEVALKNHARLEHIDVFASGDPTAWSQKIIKPFNYRVRPTKLMFNDNDQIKLIQSLGPGDSDDLSYVIIKPEDLPKGKKSKRTSKEGRPGPREKVDMEAPITGPFECLEPSTLGADGTCHQIFFSCCEYSAHFRDEHTRRRKGHRCQVCEKPLTNPGEEVFPFYCDVCGAGFPSSEELEDHTATAHVKLKPFACNICNKRFTQQVGVQQHMRRHTGDRPYACTFCPKAFTQKAGLDQHIRIHTKVKPYRCIICNKTFCQSIHLKQHMRMHTNVSPFQCEICQKQFKQISHLNYHLKNHNRLSLTEEQKLKYAELVEMTSEDVEIETDQAEVLVEEMETEQVPGEEDHQIIQIVSADGEGYILSDSGNESWSIELVQS